MYSSVINVFLEPFRKLASILNFPQRLRCFCSSSAAGPPRVAGKVAHRQSVRLGRTAKLPCPVAGDPPPLMMWTKDGRHIHSGWTRFRVLQHGLRIKEVETEDAGTYVCKATNGFGSVNINYTLIVIGERKASYDFR